MASPPVFVLEDRNAVKRFCAALSSGVYASEPVVYHGPEWYGFDCWQLAGAPVACFDQTKLLLDLLNLSVEEQEAHVRALYEAIYLTGDLDNRTISSDEKLPYGIHRLHDGELAIFRREDSDHAFKLRKPRSVKEEKDTGNNPTSKGTAKPDIARMRGVKSIKPLLTLDVYNSRCFSIVESKGKRFRLHKRVYMTFEPFYFVFLVRNDRRANEPVAQWRFVTSFLTYNRNYFEANIWNKNGRIQNGGTSKLIAITKCVK